MSTPYDALLQEALAGLLPTARQALEQSFASMTLEQLLAKNEELQRRVTQTKAARKSDKSAETENRTKTILIEMHLLSVEVEKRLAR